MCIVMNWFHSTFFFAGTVRFNPNLYNNGKVCLSLLGTWPGQEGESWIDGQSSFLQVLVSIQSLIFIPEPMFNEPGFEASIGTESGIMESIEYNEVIQEATVRYAILEQLRHPIPEFEEVFRIHFSLKKEEILNQVEKWIENSSNDAHTEKMTVLLNEVVEALEQLE